MYHVVGTYDGSNLRLYFNGSEVGSALADSTSIGAFTAALNIGRSPLGGVTGTDCQIDEVAIYGSALSAARVSAHYNAGVGGKFIQRLMSKSARVHKLRRM